MAETIGRPNSYTDEVADAICSQLADGKSLHQICKQEGFPDHKTVRGWVIDNHSGFLPKYTRAKNFGVDSQVEQAFDMIDAEQDVQRARLKVDTIKWYVSKIAPKQYGEKLTLAGDPNAPLGVQLIHSVPQPDRGEE